MTFNHYDIGSNPIDPSFFYDEVWLALCRLRRRSPPSPDVVGGKGMGGGILLSLRSMTTAGYYVAKPYLVAKPKPRLRRDYVGNGNGVGEA